MLKFSRKLKKKKTNSLNPRNKNKKFTKVNFLKNVPNFMLKFSRKSSKNPSKTNPSKKILPKKILPKKSFQKSSQNPPQKSIIFHRFLNILRRQLCFFWNNHHFFSDESTLRAVFQIIKNWFIFIRN